MISDIAKDRPMRFAPIGRCPTPRRHRGFD
jgi:hypothetical protein